jgi:hypothetical protein
MEARISIALQMLISNSLLRASCWRTFRESKIQILREIIIQTFPREDNNRYMKSLSQDKRISLLLTPLPGLVEKPTSDSIKAMITPKLLLGEDQQSGDYQT